MILPPLASPCDLEQRLGSDATLDFERAEAVLADASALVRAEGRLDWVDAAGDLIEDIPAMIPSIVIAVALRLYRNAEGIRSEAIAGYSVSYQDAGGGELALTAEERRLVRRALGGSGVGSVELVSPWPTTVPGYVPVNVGGVFPDPWGRPW